LDLRHANLSGPTLVLLVRGAVVPSAAALEYATKRPNPAAPAVFESTRSSTRSRLWLPACTSPPL